MHTLGSGPIQSDAKEQMHKLAIIIDEIINGGTKPQKWGFVVMMFPFGSIPGRCNYISNASREDITILLKEQLAYFQGMPDNIPETKQ